MTVSASTRQSPTPLDDVISAGCPSRIVLEHVTSKWGLLLLIILSEGEQRWSTLRRRADGISEKMLAQTLKMLERDGLVLRHAQATIPPRVDYSLTPRGYELSALLVPLAEWTVQNATDIVDSQRQFASG